jgi:ferredoxin
MALSCSNTAPVPVPPLAGSYLVRLKNTGEILACRAGESVLAALVRTGSKGIPVGCRGGGCGVCKVAVLSGRFGSAKPMSRSRVSEADELARHVLACCIYPQSDIEVCAIGRLGVRLSACMAGRVA